MWMTLWMSVAAATTPTFPFADRAGHTITDTPEGHASRAYPVTARNWDIDCRLEEPVGALIGGDVFKVVDGVGARDSSVPYGNQVCIRDSIGLEICHNHLHQASLTVQEGDTVLAGDWIGGCGNSGSVFSETGDGSHLDVFARLGEHKVELSHPDTWEATASLRDPRPPPPPPEGDYTETELRAAVGDRYGQVDALLASGAYTERHYVWRGGAWVSSDRSRLDQVGVRALDVIVTDTGAPALVRESEWSESGDSGVARLWMFREDGSLARFYTSDLNYTTQGPSTREYLTSPRGTPLCPTGTGRYAPCDSWTLTPREGDVYPELGSLPRPGE